MVALVTTDSREFFEKQMVASALVKIALGNTAWHSWGRVEGTLGEPTHKACDVQSG